MVKEKKEVEVTQGDKSRISWSYCWMQGVSHSLPNHYNMSGNEGKGEKMRSYEASKISSTCCSVARPCLVAWSAKNTHLQQFNGYNSALVFSLNLSLIKRL